MRAFAGLARICGQQLAVPGEAACMEGKENMSRLPRMTEWLLISLLLLAAIYVVAPQQLGVSLYKLSLITTAA